MMSPEGVPHPHTFGVKVLKINQLSLDFGAWKSRVSRDVPHIALGQSIVTWAFGPENKDCAYKSKALEQKDSRK
jgi:hypothetical protein